MRTENYLRELYFIVFAQRKIILWTTLSFLVLSVLIAFFWPPTYSASGTIFVRGKKIEKSPAEIEPVDLRPTSVTKEDLSSEDQILTSFDVIERTINDLKDRKLYKKENGETPSLFDEVYQAKGNIKTELVPASNIITVTFYDKDAQYAVTFLKALIDQYMAYRLQVYNPNKAESYFSQQADQFNERLKRKEDELMGIVSKTRAPDPQKEIENNLVLKSDLQKELTIQKSDAIDKELTIQHLDRALKDRNMHYFSFIENRPINDLSSKLQDLYIERGKTLRAYNPLSDKVKLIDKQIDDTYTQLKAEVDGVKTNILKQLKIIRYKIDTMGREIDDINTNNVSLEKQIIDTNRIERDANLYKFSYDTFAKRKEEAVAVTVKNMPSNVSILSEAFPSDGPAFPKKLIVIPLGLLIGLIMGLSFAFVREYFDHTFKKPSDVQTYVDLPVIFSIPAKKN
jgi:succinoglycan biosynthesis transport protein ExoP